MRNPTICAALIGLLACSAAACASTTSTMRAATTPRETPRGVRGGTFNVVGRADGRGDAYDAHMLFERANTALEARRCEEAERGFDQLVREFPASELVPAAHYNRGLCLQSLGRPADAATPFRSAARGTTNTNLSRDAWFRLAVVGESAREPRTVLEATEAILRIPGISLVDRVEALARRAAAQLADGDRPAAVRTANDAITLAPTREAVSALEDDTYIAEARFVVAEATRLDAAAIRIVVEELGFEQAIERRVQLVTHAHVQFNEAIRVGNPHWAAACGYSIGEMYRALHDAIVNAPLPTDWDEAAIAIYRRRTGERLRPLLTGALRAWESTLAMAQRNGIGDNTWVARTQEQLSALRELVLQPASAAPAPRPRAAAATP